ncbi:hypothetical protein [Tychonema sp. BBK16]|uniref:hypothetical protein n=1 Tax=Tychonema sp. BBK16 TaxID=2699888 RepID=UPI001F248EAE|nr:hypothetical protein [Tychonema sp. BBK16]MCF6371798.1 hypothetical protein [Tychonema sp. BBK16]
MDLDLQIRSLIDKAPADGSTPQILEAIAPALKLLAEQLEHLEYYILQNVDQSWSIAVLSNLKQRRQEKRVIYAWTTLKDASQSVATGDRILPVSIPVTHILFQMLALEGIDSIVFFDTPGNLEAGTEVRREQVQNLINVYLQQYRSTLQSNYSNLPPDIA